MPDIYTYINILQLSFQSTADYSFLLHYKIKNQLRVTGTFPDWQDWPLHCPLTFLHIFIFISRTTWPISTKLGTKHPGWRWFKFVKERATPYSKGRSLQNRENTLIKFKNLLLQNHWANFNQTWHKAFLGEGGSSLLK